MHSREERLKTEIEVPHLKKIKLQKITLYRSLFYTSVINDHNSELTSRCREKTDKERKDLFRTLLYSIRPEY